MDRAHVGDRRTKAAAAAGDDDSLAGQVYTLRTNERNQGLLSCLIAEKRSLTYIDDIVEHELAVAPNNSGAPSTTPPGYGNNGKEFLVIQGWYDYGTNLASLTARFEKRSN